MQRRLLHVDNPEYVEEQNKELFRQMGVSDMIYPEILAARDIINGLKMSWVRQRWDVLRWSIGNVGYQIA